MKDKISISDENGKVPITNVSIFDKMTKEEALTVFEENETPAIDELIKKSKTSAIDAFIQKGGPGSGVKGHTTAKELAIKKKFGELDKKRNKADALAEKDIRDGQRMIDKAAKESETAFEETLRLGPEGSEAQFKKISEKRERIKQQEKAGWDLRIKGQNRKAEISDKYQAAAMKLMNLPKDPASTKVLTGRMDEATGESIPSVITYDSIGVSQVKYRGYRINRDETVKSRPYYSVIDHKVIKGSTPKILQKKIDSFLSKKDTKKDTKIKDEPSGKEQPTLTRDAPKHTPKSNLLATKHAEAAVKRGTLFKELGKKSKKELKDMIQQDSKVDMAGSLRGMTKSNMKYYITSGKYPSPKGSEEAYNALTQQERKGLLKPIPDPKTS